MHKLIEDRQAFNFLNKMGYHYRKRLYEKINARLSPAKSTKTIKNWFLQPSKYIPKNQFDYYHGMMLHALREVLQEALRDLEHDNSMLEELIEEAEGLLDAYPADEQTLGYRDESRKRSAGGR